MPGLVDLLESMSWGREEEGGRWGCKPVKGGGKQMWEMAKKGAGWGKGTMVDCWWWWWLEMEQRQQNAYSGIWQCAKVARNGREDVWAMQQGGTRRTISTASNVPSRSMQSMVIVNKKRKNKKGNCRGTSNSTCGRRCGQGRNYCHSHLHNTVYWIEEREWEVQPKMANCVQEGKGWCVLISVDDNILARVMGMLFLLI